MLLIALLRGCAPCTVPFDVIGTTDGVLGCISEAAIDALAGSHPLLALSLLRHVGNSAVTDVLAGTPTQPKETSAAPAEPVEQKSPRKSLIHLPTAEGGHEIKMETFYVNKMHQQEQHSEPQDGGAARASPSGKGQAEGKADGKGSGGKVDGGSLSNAEKQDKADGKKTKGGALAGANNLRASGGSSSSVSGEMNEDDGTLKSLKQTVGKLKTELVKMAETEAHFTRLALTKGKEIERMRNEREALMAELEQYREELNAARNQNQAEEVNQLKQLLRTKDEEMDNDRQAADERAHVLESELERLRSDAEATSLVEAQQQNDQVAKLEASKLSLEAALASATDKIAELQEAAVASKLSRASDKAASRQRESELLGMVAFKEAERDELRLDVQKQRIGAKALACMYALKITLPSP